MLFLVLSDVWHWLGMRKTCLVYVLAMNGQERDHSLRVGTHGVVVKHGFLDEVVVRSVSKNVF